MTMDRKKFLTAVRSMLGYHKELGIDFYPETEGVRQFLASQPPVGGTKVTKPPAAAAAGAVTRPVQTAAVPDKKGDGKPAVSISDIREEVAICQACDLHKERIFPVAGRGGEQIRLMIVGDWLIANNQGQLKAGLLFGEEQETMLSRMLKAISLSVEKVFITNVIKCAVPAGTQPQAAHVDSCISYLRRQIHVLEPEVICTMGPVATRALLEKKQTLSSIRGKFHDYRISDKKTISVLPTYHPTFLLQNPEMKRATWTDLQLLAKKLDLPLSV